MDKHTPTPWSSKKASSYINERYLMDSTGKSFARLLTHRDDPFGEKDVNVDALVREIVHAMNAHEELVKELRVMVIQSCGDDEAHVCNKCRLAKQAIAKAESK